MELELPTEIRNAVDLCLKIWLDEDNVKNDITTQMLDISGIGRMKIFSKNSEPFVVCGVPIAIYVFKETSELLGFPEHNIKVISARNDGELVKMGETILELEGELRVLFALERLLINLIARLSGIATETEKLSRIFAKYGVELWATRKTTPGLRELEKYAACVGGAKPHRKNLSDGILVKDNHITVMGGMKNVVSKIIEKKTEIKSLIQKGYIFEVEVQNEAELEEILSVSREFDTMVIMLDNFSSDELARSIKKIRDFAQKNATKILIEVSGGVNIHNAKKIAELGPDRVSAGYITFSPRTPDISAEITYI